MTYKRPIYRVPLPARRRSTTVTATLRFRAPGEPHVVEHPFELTVGYYVDGRPGEVFVKAVRNLDSTIAFLLEDIAVLISLLLQHGATLPDIRHSLARGHDIAASIAAALLEHIADTPHEPPLPGHGRVGA